MDTTRNKHRRTVRTTLTLESDVAEAIKAQVSAKPDLTEKEVVNDLIRKGLRFNEISSRRQPFRLKTFKTGLVEGVTMQQLEELLDEV